MSFPYSCLGLNENLLLILPNSLRYPAATVPISSPFKVQLLNHLFLHHDTSLLFSLSRSLKGWQSPAGNAQTTSSNKNGRQYANQVCTRGVINKEKCRLTLTNHRQARRRTDATAWILTIRVTVIRRASGIAYLDTSNMSSRVQYV